MFSVDFWDPEQTLQLSKAPRCSPYRDLRCEGWHASWAVRFAGKLNAELKAESLAQKWLPLPDVVWGVFFFCFCVLKTPIGAFGTCVECLIYELVVSPVGQRLCVGLKSPQYQVNTKGCSFKIQLLSWVRCLRCPPQTRGVRFQPSKEHQRDSQHDGVLWRVPQLHPGHGHRGLQLHRKVPGGPTSDRRWAMFKAP